MRNGFLKIFFIFLPWIFVSCNQATPESLSELAGIKVVKENNQSPVKTRLKIFRQSNLIAVGNTTVAIGSSLTLRTVLVDEAGSFVQEIPATWFTSGSLASNNLSVTGSNPSKYAVFSPTLDGSGTINATIEDISLIRAYNISPTTTATGNIVASSAIIPDQIVLLSGNGQTGTVGANLAQNLKVKVLNSGNLPVENAEVTFSVSTGGGTIVTPQPVFTDSSGEASVTVQLGNVAGTNTNTFVANTTTGTVTQVVFQASSTAGTPAQLAFSQQPGGATVNTAFNSQPKIVIKDAFGNIVTNATNAVTISLSAGSGALAGTLSTSAVNGYANFTNIRYNTVETNIRLQASAAGLTSALSGLFDVGTITALAQCNAHANYTTTEGGCLDLTSGLVWSKKSTSTMTWHQAIWDSNYTDNDPEEWETNESRTHDIDAYPHADTQDGNLAGYCHDLVESGFSDWRMPTLSEIQALSTNGGGTGLQETNFTYWTSSRTGTGCTATANNKCRHNISTAASLTIGASTLYNVRCVRKPRGINLVMTTQPAAATKGFGVNVAFETQPVVTFKNSLNQTATQETIAVTVSAVGGTGVLGGTTTVNAVGGVVTFTNLKYDKAETIQLKFQAQGFDDLLSNPITVNQTYPWALCQVTANPAQFVNADGGCKDLETGYIFSAMTTGAGYSWSDVVWDSVTLQTYDDDTYDNGRTDDYALSHPALTGTDAESTNFCHDLTQSGYHDWFAIPYSVMNWLTTKSPTTSVNFHSNNIWTSSTVQATPANAYYYTSANAMSNAVKTGGKYGLCARQDQPTQLVFTTQPAGGANGLGAGVSFGVQPVVEIKDAQGARMYGYNNTIYLKAYQADGVTPATGNLYISNTYYGSTVSVNAVHGVATFAGINYDKANETIILKASIDPFYYQNTLVTIPDTNSNSIVIPSQYSLSDCASANANWLSQNGGCHNIQAGGKVWSYVFQGTYNWHQAIWDSVLPDSDPQDANDSTRVNDYDATLGPLTGSDNDTSSVCHTLRLNGYKDWRMPTYSEIDTGLRGVNRSGIDRIYKGAATYILSGATDQTTPANAYGFRVSTKTWHTTTLAKTTGYYVVCVRDP